MGSFINLFQSAATITATYAERLGAQLDAMMITVLNLYKGQIFYYSVTGVITNTLLTDYYYYITYIEKCIGISA